MVSVSNQAARLVRRLREEAGLTQSELADRVGTTQSVISRLESDDYEGHSLSMLYRVAAALDRRIDVRALGAGAAALSVRESAPAYGADADELERFAARLAQQLADRGVTRADIDEAIRWARRGADTNTLVHLRGTLHVGPGSTVDDVRRSRAQRGRDIVRGT